MRPTTCTCRSNAGRRCPRSRPRISASCSDRIPDFWVDRPGQSCCRFDRRQRREVCLIRRLGIGLRDHGNIQEDDSVYAMSLLPINGTKKCLPMLERGHRQAKSERVLEGPSGKRGTLLRTGIIAPIPRKRKVIVMLIQIRSSLDWVICVKRPLKPLI